ncbi:MAG TPA: hypothetical protein VGO27_16805 [Candidatus Acidoferrum sp.]|jgi:hypothetical protein|nr:hypothetical protein [Candidatus Acidoferrum sp.]
MKLEMRTFERDTLHAVVKGRALWLLHAVANALLIVAFFYWTRIPEATGLQFTLTIVSGLMIAFATLWLHSTTFDYFYSAEKSLKESLRRSYVCIAAFLVWALLFGLGLWCIGQLGDYSEQTGGWSRHSLPGFARHSVTPRSTFSATSWLLWFVYFFFWPILLLPVGAQVAAKNFRGFYSAAAFRPIRDLRFWVVYAICFVVGAYLPYRLVWITPTRPSALNTQTWSMVVRFGVGYLLMVTAWLVLCAAITAASTGAAEVGFESPEPIAVAPMGSR